MTRTFSHPFWKRRVTVDDKGIHEHRRDRLFASIRWDELDSLNRRGARSSRGTHISLRLTPECCRGFEECASEAWKERYPDRWQCHWECSIRKANRAAYFWFPLLILGPCVACYALFWATGWPESLQHEMQKVHRLAAVAVVLIAGFWTWYRYTTTRRNLSRLHNPEEVQSSD